MPKARPSEPIARTDYQVKIVTTILNLADTGHFPTISELCKILHPDDTIEKKLPYLRVSILRMQDTGYLKYESVSPTKARPHRVRPTLLAYQEFRM